MAPSPLRSIQGNLNQSFDRITCHAQMMLQSDFCCILNLLIAAA